METRRIQFCISAPVLAGIRSLAADSQPEYFSPLPDEIYWFFQPRWGVFGSVVWVFTFFFFFNFLCFRPGILFTASDRSCDGPGGAIPAPKLLHLPPSLLLQLHAWVPGPEDLSQARRTDEVRKVHCGSLY